MAEEIAKRGDNDLASLGPLLADRLTHSQERVCFLVGSGMVIPQVPGVAEVVARAKTWIEDNGDGSAPDVEAVGPEEYGQWMRSLLLRFQADGQRAFVQRLALDAYIGADGDELRERLARTRQPLPEQEFAALVDALDAWAVPDGLATMAEIIKQHERLPRRILTTNFDPLITIALRRVGLEVRPLSVATDTNWVADRTRNDAVTVWHLHGDCYEGVTLHTAAELQTNRSKVWQELIDYLRGKNLFVVGYSGWDDIVRESMRVVLRPGGDFNVAWPVLEPDEASLRQVHPHLVRMLQENAPQALPYYGVDRDALFADLRLRIRSATPALSAPPRPITAAQVLHQQLGFGQDGLDNGCPTVLFWPHRLRRPHLLHGVHALAAAALARDGAKVELHLDDIGVDPEDVEHRVEEFSAAVRAWFTVAGAPQSPTIVRYSQQLDLDSDETRSELWGIAERINQTSTTVRELLSATKVIDPRAFDAPPEKFARYLTDNLDERAEGRLLRPVLNFQMLRQTIARHGLADDEGAGIATLGGRDERPMWTLWQQVFHLHTGHLFVPRLLWQPRWRLWSQRPLLRATDFRARDLEEFLISVVQQDGADAFLQWVWNCGIRLWSWLEGGEADTTLLIGERTIASAEDAVAAMKETPAQAAQALVERVGAWFYAEA